MNNRYYTGKLPNSEMSKVYKVIVGTAENQVRNLSGKDIVVKLCEGDKLKHPCLNSFKKLTHQEAVLLVASWATNHGE